MAGRISTLILVLCFVPTLGVRAQGTDDAQIIEEDYRVTNVEERRRSVDSLLSKVNELKNAGQTIEAARTLNRVGRFQIRMFLAPDAAKTFQDALDLLEQRPDIKTRIDSLNGLASSYDHQSKCDQAEPLANEIVKLSEQHGYAAGQADALLTLSDCQNHRDHSLALQTAHRSLELWRSIDRKRGMADAYKVIGHYQLSQNDLLACTRSMEASLGLYRELNDSGRQASVLTYLAMVEHRKGNWQNALALYTQVQSMIDEKAEPYKMGQIAVGLGDAFLESGLPDIALAKYRAGLEYFRTTKNQRAVSILHWAIGKAHYFLGEYQQAIDNLKIAHKEAEATEDLTLKASCDDFLGRTYGSLGDYKTSLIHLESALDGYSQAKNTMEAARTQALIGQIYQQRGSLKQAAIKYQIALKTFRDLADRLNESATLFAIGNLELQLNNLVRAEDYLRRSIDVTENIRRNSTSNDLTVAFSATVYDRYQSYIECLMRQEKATPGKGFAERAFETNELAKARSLTELLRATETNLAPGVDPALVEREKSLRQALKVKEDYLVTLLARTYKREEVTSIENELAQIENEYKQVVSAIQTQNPSYQQITRPAAWRLTDIQEKVVSDDQTILLEYSLGKERSYVWVVTHDRLISYELPAETEIVEKSQILYRLLTSTPAPANNNDLTQASLELSKMVLFPVGAELNKQRIILVADGVLHYVPFQILYKSSDDPTLLVSNHEVVNAPSASILAGLQQEAARPPRTKLLAVFADPALAPDHSRQSAAGSTGNTPNDSLDNQRWQQGLRDIQIDGDTFDTSNIKPLFFVKRELANLRELSVGRQTLIAAGSDATRERLLSTDLTQYTILHFATHGLLDSKNPQNSGLVLSTTTPSGQRQNGFVSLQDIYQLRAPVVLVVLSACQTGLGKDVRGEGLIGLTRGFMYAGASSVVASLWKVDDEATAELMKHFYTNMLQKGMPPAAALRSAQNSIRQQPQWSSPYYWAAFTLQGDYRQVIPPSPRQTMPSLAVFIIVFIGLGLSALAWWHFQRSVFQARNI